MSDWEVRESESEAESVDNSESEVCDGDSYVVESISVDVHESREYSEAQGPSEDSGEKHTQVIEVPFGTRVSRDITTSYHLEGDSGVDPWGDDAKSDKKE